MIQGLKDLVHNLIVLLLLATFLDLLLPKTTFTRHIRLVVGLFVMFTILQSVLQLFNWQGTLNLSIREPPEAETTKILRAGREFRAAQETTALQAAEQRLEQQLEAMIYLNLGLDEVDVDLTLENMPEQGPVVSQATIYLSPGRAQGPIKKVEPVVVDTGEPSPGLPPAEVQSTPELEQWKERIVNGVSAYLGLDQAKVQVTIGSPAEP